LLAKGSPASSPAASPAVAKSTKKPAAGSTSGAAGKPDSPAELAARQAAIAAAINSVGGGTPKSGGSGSGSGEGPSGPGNGAGQGSGGGSIASELGWYNEMIHDRFHEQWDQPTVAAGVPAENYVALLKIRIEKDGRVSSYSLSKPSGVAVMDSSVLAAAARVKKIAPLPDRLAKRGAYEIAIKFERD
jgi:TonB family protein